MDKIVSGKQLNEIKDLLKSKKCKEMISDLTQKTKEKKINKVFSKNSEELSKLKKFAVTEAEKIVKNGGFNNPFKGKRLKKGQIKTLKNNIKKEENIEVLLNSLKNPKSDDEEIDDLIDSLKNTDKELKVTKVYTGLILKPDNSITNIDVRFENIKEQVIEIFTSENFVSEHKILPNKNFMYIFWVKNDILNFKCTKMFGHEIYGKVLIFVKNKSIDEKYLMDNFSILNIQTNYIY